MVTVKNMPEGTSHRVHSSAVVGTGTMIGDYTSIMKGVMVGAECEIGQHVVIHPDTIIEDGVRIDDHATIGKLPMRSVASAFNRSDQPEPARIGSGCLVGTSAILYRGCRIGNHVLIADQATVREDSTVGDYTIIGRNVALESQVIVGRLCKIEAGAYVAGPSEIEEGCFVAPGVVVTNDNFMGRTEARKRKFRGIRIEVGGRIGANSTILPGKRIAPDGVVAAGAVVTRDVPARTVVSGLPARYLRDVTPEEFWRHQEPVVRGDLEMEPRGTDSSSRECERNRGSAEEGRLAGYFFNELTFEYQELPGNGGSAFGN